MQTLPAREGDPDPPPDNGQHIALGCCTEYLRFLERVGQERLLPARAARAAGDRARTAPSRSSGPGCSPSSATGTFRCATGWRSRASRVGSARLEPAEHDGETFAHAPASAGPVAGGDRPLLGRVHPPGPQPAQRDVSAALGDLHRADRAPRRADGLRSRPAGRAARRDARRGGRARARASGVRPCAPGARVAALEEGAAVLADGERVEGEASSSPCPRARARALLGEPEPALEDSPIVSAHLLFDRRVLRLRAGGAAREPRALGLRPRAG